MTRVEYAITHRTTLEKESLPYPKFEDVYWQGFPEEEQIQGKKVEINGQEWIIEVVGFQGSEGVGHVQMHQEPTQQEDVFFLCGSGEMTIWNGMECVRRPNERNYWEHNLLGVMNKTEAGLARYVLAVASDRETKREKFVLNVTKQDGTALVIEPVSTRQRQHHSTRLGEPSLYFVVKRSPITVDTHELVDFSGAYGGGGD